MFIQVILIIYLIIAIIFKIKPTNLSLIFCPQIIMLKENRYRYLGCWHIYKNDLPPAATSDFIRDNVIAAFYFLFFFSRNGNIC